MNFKPYADKIIIKPIKKEKSDGGIILTEMQGMENLIRGEVVAISDGFLFGNKEWPVTSVVGDIVWFQEGVGAPFPFEGEQYLMLQDGAVLGKEIRETKSKISKAIKKLKDDEPLVCIEKRPKKDSSSIDVAPSDGDPQRVRTFYKHGGNIVEA